MAAEVLVRKQWSWKDIIASWEDPGRKWGQAAGTYVTDLSALYKTLILCPMCQHAFNWRRHGYYNVTHYEHIYCVGTCDGCRTYTNKGLFLIHDANVNDCWQRRDKKVSVDQFQMSPHRSVNALYTNRRKR